jgi:NADH-quinone oxidoreductase subunit J
MQTSALVLFVIHALIIGVGGIMAVASRSLVRALVGLIMTLFGVSGMYLLLNAPFIALMQLLIYVGAVVILIFFAIMLTKAPAGGEEERPNQVRTYLLALMAGVLPTFVIGWVVLTDQPASINVPLETGLKVLGQGLMEPYFLAFELISVVLLVAMSAAVILAFKRRQSR